MTAEEYIEKNSMEDYGDFDIDLQENTKLGTFSISKGDAIKAIEMARKEEREKAIKALNIVLMAIFEKGNHSMSMGDLIGHFEKLLNQ